MSTTHDEFRYTLEEGGLAPSAPLSSEYDSNPPLDDEAFKTINTDPRSGFSHVPSEQDSEIPPAAASVPADSRGP